MRVLHVISALGQGGAGHQLRLLIRGLPHDCEVVTLARAGTVTFLGPLLPRHPVGIITIEGAPQSHLGILSREFGLPAVMSINLVDSPVERVGANGVPNEEYIDYVAKTLDGQRVILDCSDAREGKVYAA